LAYLSPLIFFITGETANRTLNFLKSQRGFVHVQTSVRPFVGSGLEPTLLSKAAAPGNFTKKFCSQNSFLQNRKKIARVQSLITIKDNPGGSLASYLDRPRQTTPDIAYTLD